jgi:hypothetical protein
MRNQSATEAAMGKGKINRFKNAKGVDRFGVKV